MRILALDRDLLFRSKIDAAASQAASTVQAAPDAASLARALAGAPADVAVLDLESDAADPFGQIAAIQAAWPSTPILGYCSHAQVELQHRARQAGCAWAGPRSGFLEALTQHLSARP